jgi:hypothetical protein
MHSIHYAQTGRLTLHKAWMAKSVRIFEKEISPFHKTTLLVGCCPVTSKLCHFEKGKYKRNQNIRPKNAL